MRKVIAVLLLALVLPLFAQDDSMPAYITIRAVERGDPADPMSYLPGYAVQVDGHSVMGGKVIPPKYCELIISDATVGEIRAIYTADWQRAVDWEFVGHDLTIDGHRLNVFVQRDLVSQSGLNGLARSQIENYLNSWGGSVVSIAANSVVFDARIADAIESDGFWGLDLSGGIFTELAYDQVTGIHTTRISYNGIAGATPAKVAARIVERGCTVTANQPGQSRMTFTCGRDLVFNAFKLDVKAKLDGVYSRRKWRLTQAAVDAIMTAGGSMTVTRDQMLDLWHSRLND